MVARDIILAELTGAHLHIAHISTAGAVRLVREARARGVRVTAEVTPHHLVLTDEAVRSYDPNCKMAPPLRTKRDVEACLEGLIDGTIDCVATDHAPHATSEKEGEFAEAANGIVGLETAVPLLLDRLVRPGVVDLPTLVARLSTGPARLLNLPGGSLAPGRGGRRHHPRSRAALHGGPGRVPVAEPEHALRRLHRHRRAVDDAGRRRQGDAVTRPALLALADGRVFRGEALGASGEGPRRGGLQHLDDRLPGDPHRSVVSRADRLHDLPAHRQLRDQPGGRRVAPPVAQRVHRQGSLSATPRAGARGSRSTPTCASTGSSASRASTPARSPVTCATTARRKASSRPRSGTARASPSGRGPCPDCSGATWSPR